jgi:hypothetical protein
MNANQVGELSWFVAMLFWLGVIILASGIATELFMKACLWWDDFRFNRELKGKMKSLDRATPRPAGRR